jgi:hypothetical protein
VDLASYHPLWLRYLYEYIFFAPLYLHDSKKLVSILTKIKNNLLIYQSVENCVINHNICEIKLT